MLSSLSAPQAPGEPQTRTSSRSIHPGGVSVLDSGGCPPRNGEEHRPIPESTSLSSPQPVRGRSRSCWWVSCSPTCQVGDYGVGALLGQGQRAPQGGGRCILPGGQEEPLEGPKAKRSLAAANKNRPPGPGCGLSGDMESGALGSVLELCPPEAHHRGALMSSPRLLNVTHGGH